MAREARRGEGVHDHCLTNDVGTLAAALYVKTDDLLKQAPHLARWQPNAPVRTCSNPGGAQRGVALTRV